VNNHSAKSCFIKFIVLAKIPRSLVRDLIAELLIIKEREDLEIIAYGFDPRFGMGSPARSEKHKDTIISLFGVALSDFDGKSNFYLEPSSMFARNFDTKKVEVSTITFGSFIDQQNVKISIDDLVVLKIDTEGAEEKILRGCADYLSAVDVIQFEIGEFSRLAGSNLKSIMELLGADFSLYIISFVYGLVPLELEKLSRWDGFDTSNFVAIRESSLG
jgi:FkbM family methyltransferase